MTTAAASSTVMVPQGRGGVVAAFGPGAGTTPAFDKGDTPSFADLIDVINPLQHIPVINTVYRAITGDHESAFADVVGGALYGGPVGAGLAVADLGMRDATGKTVGEHAMAWLGIGDGGASKASDTAVAAASQPAAQVAAAAQAKTLTAVPMVKTAGPSNASGTSKQTAKADTKAAAAEGPILTPATLVANDVMQPAAKTGTATPAIVSTASPYAAPAEAEAESGPVTAGDYLVFGGTAPAGQSASAAPQAATMQVASANAAGGKTFATLGANVAPAASLPDVAPTTPAVAAAATPSSNQVASAADKPRLFRIPPRNGPSAPPATLPPPTTGPAALPGGKSMALSAQEAVQQDPQHNFLTAYTQALDKYRNAQRLAGQAPTTTSDDAPANLLQPAAAVAPASDADSAITLH